MEVIVTREALHHKLAEVEIIALRGSICIQDGREAPNAGRSSNCNARRGASDGCRLHILAGAHCGGAILV
jgi:hypothetical protein